VSSEAVRVALYSKGALLAAMRNCSWRRLKVVQKVESLGRLKKKFVGETTIIVEKSWPSDAEKSERGIGGGGGGFGSKNQRSKKNSLISIRLREVKSTGSVQITFGRKKKIYRIQSRWSKKRPISRDQNERAVTARRTRKNS